MASSQTYGHLPSIGRSRNAVTLVVGLAAQLEIPLIQWSMSSPPCGAVLGTGEVTALAQLPDAQFDGSEVGFLGPLAVTVAGPQIGAAAATRRVGQPFRAVQSIISRRKSLSVVFSGEPRGSL